jgi:tetratricopeptide (TPR) repeat protein
MLRTCSIFAAFTAAMLFALTVYAGEADAPKVPAGKKKSDTVKLAEKVEELVDLLEDDDESVKKQAKADLMNLGVSAVKPLARLIERGEYAKQREDLREILSIILKEYLEELASGATSETIEARKEFTALGRAGVVGLKSVAEGPDGKVKTFALEVIAEMVKKHIANLDSSEAALRDESVATLFDLGRYATRALEKRAGMENTPGLDFLVRRALRMIRFRISPTLFLKTGTLLEGYENGTWREKREMVDFIARQGRLDAVDAIKAIIETETDQKVREFAGESLLRIQGGKALEYIRKQGIFIKELAAITRDIHMSQGIRFLSKKMYEKAEKEFKLILDKDLNDEMAHYNLACALSLQLKVEEAVRAFACSVDCGYEDVDHMEKDSDLDNIRDHPVYIRIIKKLRIKYPRPEEADKPEEPELPK